MIAVRAALGAVRAAHAALGHALDALDAALGSDEPAPKTPAPSEVLDVESACELLDVSRSTLHRLVRDGQIRERRLGDSPRYLRSELIEDLRR